MKKIIVLFLAVLMLAGCGQQPKTTEEPAVTEDTVLDDAEESTEETAEEEAAEPVEEEPQPIYADQIADGDYEINVDSSASMFRVVKCVLHVEGDTMTAAMTMSGQGYGMVYMGTGEEALADAEDTYIPFELDADGAKTFTVPVEALNMEQDCAAWSIRKETWYDRVLVFESELIPAASLNLE